MNPGPLDPAPAGDATERVRACPACGEVVAYALRTCPACGHLDPLGGETATRACVHCAATMAADGLFCGHCGREQQTSPLPPAPVVGDLEPAQAGGVAALLLVLTLLGPLTLLAAVLAAYV